MAFSVFKKTENHRSPSMISPERLERAMAEDELNVYFMPVVSIPVQSTLEVEALLRWQLDEDKFIPPMEFIPLAQEYGLMPRLTRWVIQKVLAYQHKWRKRGTVLHWSVNTTSKDIDDASLVHFVEDLLQEYQLPPACLGLEVSQRTMQQIGNVGMENLQAYQSLGVQLILDNFDPQQDVVHAEDLWHQIKIERDMIMKRVGDSDLEQTVKQFVDRYHQHQVSITASGVHTYREWEFVKKIQCDAAQGFYLSPPQTSSDLEIWMQVSNWGYENTTGAHTA